MLLGDTLDIGAALGALAQGLFARFELFRLFTGASGVLGGGLHGVDLGEVVGGGVSLGKLFQLGAVLLDLRAAAFYVVFQGVGVLPGGKLAAVQRALQFLKVGHGVAQVGFDGGGAGVLIKRVRGREGGAVAVEIVGINICVVLNGEHVARKIGIIAGVDGDAGAGLGGAVVDAVEAL